VSEPTDLNLEGLSGVEQSVTDLRAHLDRRFDDIETALGKIVNVLEAHDQRLERIVGRLDPARA
jgi:hypothetical protein